MIWSIAWRNVWRNKVRSIVMIVAIALGLFAGVFTMAFMQGVVDARIESATKSELAHLQIHAPHFQDNNETTIYLQNSTGLVDEIEKTKTDLLEIKDLETLRAYYKQNSGKGKEVTKLITDKSEELKKLKEQQEEVIDLNPENYPFPDEQ
jgi:ABC-type lipoprotein release transport system permease subunit